MTLRIAVGKNETNTATSAIAAVKTGRCLINGANGSTSKAHGNSSGRLLALAPTNNAAARPDIHKSFPRRDLHARHPKSIAASAYAVGNVSFPALPACRRKL